MLFNIGQFTLILKKQTEMDFTQHTFWYVLNISKMDQLMHIQRSLNSLYGFKQYFFDLF